jgi:[ribosomal protein S5]-alanine N-acetyltransferase|uniref:GNAT family N-acetyltransferase n=1 Tax=Cephaloticoccus sp. TaxID=1985742 RepID=UPI00404A1855
MIPPETFNTARLHARKPRREDAPAAFAVYASDPIATKYLAWKPYTEVAPLADFFSDRIKDWATSSGHYGYMLCLKNSDLPIGSIGFIRKGHQAIFGYVLGQKYWGTGYMTEALSYLLTWAMAQPDIFRAGAFCDVDNPASARVMEKAGMTREGILRRYHIAPNISPEPRDCIMCAKVR